MSVDQRLALPPFPLRALQLSLLLSLLLAGCGSAPRHDSAPTAQPAATGKTTAKKPVPANRRGGGYYLDDGPADDIPENLDAIPDAVPRWETLARAPNRPYVALGKEYIPNTAVVPYKARGIASWYGKKYHGQKTSIGEAYDMFGMTAAHPTLAIPSYVRVVNPNNGKSVVVRVNDRGPFHADRVIDLSYTAAWKLGIINNGSGQVEVEAILPGDATHTAYAQVAAPVGGGNKVLAKIASPVAVAMAPVEARPLQLSAADRAELQALETKLHASEKASPPRGNSGNVNSPIFLQLGAFASADNAESLKSRISRDLDWLSDPINVTPANGLHRVRLGPYASRSEAEKVADRIHLALGYKPTLVMR